MTEVIPQSGMMSTLNPNAPMFVPQKYRAVEDFSEQWWALVGSSPWFRDYWLQERFLDPSSSFSFDDPIFLPDDLDDEFYFVDELYPNQHQEKEEQRGKELVSVGMLRWQKGRASAQAPKYVEKAPKIVRLKVSPRPIHQPK